MKHGVWNIECSRKVQFGFLLLIGSLSFFVNIGSLEPSIMEARNFITAREMIENDTWLLPTMNGEYRLAKPPLPTWITALAGLMAGDIYNETALRIPAAVMALLMIFFVYGLTGELTKDKSIPFLAAGVLSTSFYLMFMARQGTWDIYCHSFMVGAIWAMTAGWKRKGTAYGEFTLAGVLLGLSFMSKGPVSFYVLLLPFMIAYMVAFGTNEIRNKWRELLTTLLLCLVISTWWPIYVYFHIPDDLIQNINTETGSWKNRHERPFWHYWNFPVQSGIWTIFITAALIIPYAKGRIKQVGGNYKFLIFWVLLTIIFLSIIPEKKERYLMPGLISQAVLVGFYLKYLINSFKDNLQSKSDKFILVFNTTLLAIICIGTPLALYFYGFTRSLIPVHIFIGYTLIMVFFSTVFIAQLWKKQVMKILLAIFLLMGFLSATLPYFYKKMLFNDLGNKHLSELSKMESIQNLTFYSIGNIRPEEIWDVRKMVTPLQHQRQIGSLNKDSLVLFLAVDKDSINHSTIEGKISYQHNMIGYFEHPSNRENIVWMVSIVSPGLAPIPKDVTPVPEQIPGPHGPVL